VPSAEKDVDMKHQPKGDVENGGDSWTLFGKWALRIPSCDLELGGDKGARTPDLLHAMQALSQLSYIPTLP
jgi:hypothetical protein